MLPPLELGRGPPFSFPNSMTFSSLLGPPPPMNSLHVQTRSKLETLLSVSFVWKKKWTVTVNQMLTLRTPTKEEMPLGCGIISTKKKSTPRGHAITAQKHIQSASVRTPPKTREPSPFLTTSRSTILCFPQLQPTFKPMWRLKTPEKQSNRELRM